MKENLKRIGVMVAMDKEFAQLKTLLDEAQVERHGHSDFVTGHIGEKEIVMHQCGVGKVNSAVGTVEMINNYHPDLVVSTGVAGGAQPTLNPLDVVVASECTYHDAYCGSEMEMGQIMGMPARYRAPKELVEKALQLSGNTRVLSGLMVTGDWFVDSREKMQAILATFPDAMAVDMESCSIAQVCRIYTTPFISFRIISDVPLKDHEASQYFDFWNRMADGSFTLTKSFLNLI
jgi:adenosylhomocysteine nucleosidase